jgi:hypothetical protein
MADADSRLRLGKIISGIGSVWIALYFASRFLNVGGTPVGDILAFFGSNFFVPIALLFTGRAIKRRSRQVSVEDALGTETVEKPRPKPAPPPRVERRPSPPPPDTAPKPVDMDELAEATGFDPSDHSGASLEHMDDPAGPMTSEEMIAEAHRRYDKKD